MVAASHGPTETHRDRVRILAAVTLLLFTASLFSTGAALAEPKHTTDLLPQTIDFALPESGTVGATLPLQGIANSGLPLTYEAKPPSRCAVEDTELRLTAEGKCKVEASQAGDDVHAPAAVGVEIEVNAPRPDPVDGTRPALQPEPKP